MHELCVGKKEDELGTALGGRLKFDKSYLCHKNYDGRVNDESGVNGTVIFPGVFHPFFRPDTLKTPGGVFL